MRKPILILVAVLATLALLAAGCGGDDSDDSGNSGNSSSSGSESSGAEGNGADTTETGGGGGAATSLKLTADPGGALKFDETELSAKPGKVTIVMDNPSSVPHAVEVEGKGVEEETKTLTKGTADVTVDLKAGKYEFYCPVDGHREAGMEGTLTVG
ncbi:MAG: cupredoxin domain-containing protein [Thermoleophilaceae bacterium]|nr:cupredoxin domain-containing protein [Thermoleophilaceae bacterium]